MKKYIAYYRVSTSKQCLGLDAQRTSVHNYLSSNGGELINEFSEKESGKDDNRVTLVEAIKQCKKNNATLIIAKLDRLSRNVSFVFALKDANIDFLACDLPTFNTLTLAIFIGLAQQEREMISQRTKLALNELKLKGVKLGRPNAQFTDADRAKSAQTNKDNANLNENNLRAKMVIEEMIKTTKNKSEIARRLNENGFKTSNGCEFTPMQVKRLIQRYGLGK
ncbi:recombinase family protein [Bacteroides cellulosilyticus]|uniref:recombinase family protein n=1 Tax=Bacteroides cellulosilyticus TaxID=246787 RepID=UPI0032C04AE2